MRVYLLLLSLVFIAACGGNNGNGTAAVPVGVTALTAPPALPEYDQPAVPVAGNIWTPGYWTYDTEYYWVPGTWVAAPAPGLYWTPPYWAWNENVYAFHEGWWGAEVGYYGGINYGFGYFGSGFQGGMWQGREFYYNQEVTNVDITIVRNVYRNTVINNNYVSRVSYNGGSGGVVARETSEEMTARTRQVVRPTAEPTQHAAAARQDPQCRASVNPGQPTVAATTQPGKFSGPGVVRPRETETPTPETPRQPERQPQPTRQPSQPERQPQPEHQPQPAHQPTQPERPAQPQPRSAPPTAVPQSKPRVEAAAPTTKEDTRKTKPGA